MCLIQFSSVPLKDNTGTSSPFRSSLPLPPHTHIKLEIRKPLHRQQRLEQLAEKFSRKAGLRETWLTDMSQVLDELNKGQDVHGVDAALKRHEAISADIQAGETRMQVRDRHHV